MRSLSSDAALQHGLNPSANIVDELHAHKSAELYTALTTGTGAREQPFTLWITTAGVAGEGILAELFDSMFTGSGELEDRGSLLIYRDRVNGTLIYWYGAPRDADIEDPAVWYAANPVSWLHDGKYLGAQFARLRARGALLEWRRYHLNQFVGFEDTWLRDGAWRATAGDLPLNVARCRSASASTGAPTATLGAVAVAQRQGDRVVVRAQVFAAGVRDRDGQHRGDARPPARAARSSSRCRRPATRRRSGRSPGPAFAFDRLAFGESAEILEQDGLTMVDVPMTAAVMGPPSTLTLRAHHDRAPRPRRRPDPRRARRQHDRGPDRPGHEDHPRKHGSTRPNVAARGDGPRGRDGDAGRARPVRPHATSAVGF